MEDAFEGLQVKADETQRHIAYLEELLQKSEKYERLMQDDDFKSAIADIQQTVDAHDSEIKLCLDGMSQYTPKLLQDAFHSIHVHQILKEQAVIAMKRPEQILKLAKEARSKLPELRDQLTNLKGAISNG